MFQTTIQERNSKKTAQGQDQNDSKLEDMAI